VTGAFRRHWREALVAALATVAVANAGALLTDLGPWYQALRQPWWKPPDWAFGPAWTTIFALAAASATIAWVTAPDAGARRLMLVAFGLNAALNVLWSILFFQMQRPDYALVEVVALFASIVLMMAVVSRWAPRAAWLLAPYLVWVAFAASVNLGVVWLNPAA
jgi:tryptophan-rich sensory protein